MGAWTDHVSRWKDCEKCPLCQQRDRICLARGTLPCDVLFIGEAPGASEDAIGRPFVGPAGALLDQIIDRSIGKLASIAMTNLVCCYPREAKERGDNQPGHSDILSCRPRLIEFVNIARPKLIVCVGSLASEYVDHRDSVQCVDVVHPAAILRMPLAQKQMAVQRVVVTLLNAVNDVLLSGTKNFTEWGKHASITPRDRVRADYDDWAINPGDRDIPF